MPLLRASARRCRGAPRGRRRCPRRPGRSATRRPSRLARRRPRSRAAADDGRGQRMLARLLERGREPRARRRSVNGASGDDVRRAAACPSVSVPVLSTTSVSTVSSRSSASAFLTSTPAPAPRPVPTMIAIGVARPSAHGQAMMSTATALTSACASRGSGPHRLHADERQRPRSATTAGTNQAATTIGQPLDRRTRALRFARPSGRSARAACRRRRARRASRSVPVPLIVPPVTRAPGSFSTGIGSPVTIDSSTDAAPLDDDAVDRDLLARPDAQQVADRARRRAARPLRGRRGRRAPSSAPGRAAAGSRALVWPRARSSSTCPSSTSTVMTTAVSK